MTWTVEDIGDQSARTVLITGATDGVGLAAARELAKHKAHLVLACRNPTKMAGVATDLRALGASSVHEVVCDLADLDSVRSCATAEAMPDSIDVLLLNAGVNHPAPRTRQGYEHIIAINHLGHFLLAALLMPSMRDGGRIVVVSSISHQQAQRVAWDVVAGSSGGEEGDGGGTGLAQYEESKLANLLFVEELNRRLVAKERDVVAVGAHPGFSKSHIMEAGPPSAARRITKLLMRIVAQPTEHGAWPLLMAATDKQPKRGEYYVPSRGWLIAEVYGPPMRGGSKSTAVTNEELALECWQQSEKLTETQFVV